MSEFKINKFLYSDRYINRMNIDIIFFGKIIIILAAFIMIVRFIFSSSDEEKNLAISKSQLKEELEDIKNNIAKKKIIPSKEEGELIDSLMEDYYKGDYEKIPKSKF
jgi:hypothetical protein